MTSVFKIVLQMSITASYVIAVVMLLRLLMRRFPKKYSYYLWSAVFFRLCCPFSFRSILSIFNFSAKRGNDIIIDLSEVPVSPSMTFESGFEQINIGSPAITEIVNETLVPQETVTPPAVTPIQPSVPSVVEKARAIDPVTLISVIWLVGMVLLIVYALVSYYRIKRRLILSNSLYDNVRQADIDSPFIMGLIRPIIYVPFEADESELKVSIAHERYHLKRKDHWIRLFAYILLCMHWFNPLCWIAYKLMIKDMEMSCDEHVLSTNNDMRIAYSNALLNFATDRRSHLITPVTFGGVSVKERIKNVLSYKRASTVTSVIAAILCVLVLAACIFNGKAFASQDDPEAIDDQTETADAVPGTDNPGTQSYGKIRRVGKPVGMIAGSAAKTSRGYYAILPWSTDMMPEGTNYVSGNIVYTDYASKQTYYLCNKRGCLHNSPDCNSFLQQSDGMLFTDYSEDHLYLIRSGHDIDGEPNSIIQMDMDGSNRKIVCRLGSNETFTADMVYIVSDEYMYTVVGHAEAVDGSNKIVSNIERIWFEDGRREVVCSLENDLSHNDMLVSTADDIDLIVRTAEAAASELKIYQKRMDQSGNIIETDGPYASTYPDSYFSYWGDNLRVHLETDGTYLSAEGEYIDSGEKVSIRNIPCDQQIRSIYIGMECGNRLMMYFYDRFEDNHSYVLDFSEGTWKEFDLRMRNNSSNFVTPIAEAGEDYMVLVERNDQAITRADSNGQMHKTIYRGRPTYALISKEDFWNSVPNYRIIEDKLDAETHYGQPPDEASKSSISLTVPLAEVQYITRDYDKIDHPYIEFAAAEGTDVIAAYSGKVGSMDYIDKKGYYVIIEQDSIVQIMYSHMASLSVSTGDTVKQGDVIGTIGSTGDGRDPSLEFRVFVPSMGLLESQIDPKLLLPDIDQ